MLSTVKTLDVPDAVSARGFLSRRIVALQSKAKNDKLKELYWKSTGWVVDDFFTNLDLENLENDNQEKNAAVDDYNYQRLVVEKLQGRLKSNKHYLVSWMGFSVHDDPPVSEVASCLQDPEKVDELLQALFNSPSNCLRTAKKIADHVYADDGSVQILVLFFVEAYIAIAYQGGRQGQMIGEVWSPERLIKIGREFGYQLADKGLDHDYLPGVEYLHKYASLHNILFKRKSIENLRWNDYNPDEEFQILPGRSKALVMAAECLVWSAMRTMIPSGRDKCCSVLKEIIVLDPDRYEWHYQIGSYLRLSRRRLDTKMCITVDEETILWETYDKCKYKKYNEDGSDSDLNRKAYAGVIQGLAEKVLYRFYNRTPKNTPLTFGDLYFKGDEEGVQYIMDGIKKIMANIDNPDPMKCPNYAESIRCGDILSSILPKSYKDYELAEKYFLHALTRAGTYSKIYHKLGVLYSRAEQVRDHTKALKYLRLCYSVDSCNIPGATDLLKALMAYPVEHASEISAVISQGMLAPSMHKRDQSVFYFIQGCLQLCLKNPEAAIEAWMSAERCIKTGQECFKYPIESVFSNLRSVRNLRWNWDVLNPKEILKTISDLKNSCSGKCSEEKMEFFEKSEKFLSSLAPIKSYNNNNRRVDATTGAVQQRARYISDDSDTPRVLISDQDSNWRGIRNRDVVSGNSTSTDSSDFKMYSRRARVADSHQQADKRNWNTNHNQTFNRRNQNTENKYRQSRRSPSPQNWR